MDHQTAAYVVSMLKSAASLISESTELQRDGTTPEEFKAATKATGEILALIFIDLMDPIVRQYPDLEPYPRRE